jgi:hypothetical protein
MERARLMLAFLDALCHALAAHNCNEVRRHLRHPLARALPHVVRREAFAIARGARRGQVAPIQALHFYYQTLQLFSSPDADHAMGVHFALPQLDPAAHSALTAAR